MSEMCELLIVVEALFRPMPRFWPATGSPWM
jgi:hypothetical protein